MTKTIMKENKSLFLQQLLYEEVIEKREHNLKAFLKGLNCLNIGDLIKGHSSLTSALFVAPADPTFTSEAFFKLVSSQKPVVEDWAKAFDYFKEYVIYLEGT